MSLKPIVLGITGASGVPYAVRLLEILAAQPVRVHLSISDCGRQVLRQELQRQIDLDAFRLETLLPEVDLSQADIHYHHYKDFFSPIASGSYLTEAMVICPCSGTTLSGIVHATGGNLIQRAAEVHLKERRKLILVPRETPLSVVQLENYYRAGQVGAVVLPAMPGFYHGAKTISDLVDFVVARILDQLGIRHELMKRWGSQSDHDGESC